MISSFGSSMPVASTWTLFKTNLLNRRCSIQYDDDGAVYTVFAFDGPVAYFCNIWKGTVPGGIAAAGYTQGQNDTDKTEFEGSYKVYCNQPIVQGGFADPRLIRRFGNLTSASVSEVLLCARGYAEQSSQAQRSVVSTSATDSDGAATGLRQVRIAYLDSNYVSKTVDVLTNGTTAVDTSVSDIRFVESMVGIKGVEAVGAVKLMSATAGGGVEICGIGVATQDAFLCHHYVPAGMRAVVRSWDFTCDDDVKGKLKGQTRFGSNLVDVVLDLDNVTGVTAAGRATGGRTCDGIVLGEKTYVRVMVVPGQAGSTITRGNLVLFEDKAVS